MKEISMRTHKKCRVQEGDSQNRPTNGFFSYLFIRQHFFVCASIKISAVVCSFVLFLIEIPSFGQAPAFYFGNDLSYVNQMEDCGAVFKEKGESKDVYQIFADHGTNLVRVRLWVDPSWWQSPLEQ